MKRAMCVLFLCTIPTINAMFSEQSSSIEIVGESQFGSACRILSALQILCKRACYEVSPHVVIGGGPQSGKSYLAYHIARALGARIIFCDCAHLVAQQAVQEQVVVSKELSTHLMNFIYPELGQELPHVIIFERLSLLIPLVKKKYPTIISLIDAMTNQLIKMRKKTGKIMIGVSELIESDYDTVAGHVGTYKEILPESLMYGMLPLPHIVKVGPVHSASRLPLFKDFLQEYSFVLSKVMEDRESIGHGWLSTCLSRLSTCRDIKKFAYFCAQEAESKKKESVTMTDVQMAAAKLGKSIRDSNKKNRVAALRWEKY